MEELSFSPALFTVQFRQEFHISDQSVRDALSEEEYNDKAIRQETAANLARQKLLDKVRIAFLCPDLTLERLNLIFEALPYAHGPTGINPARLTAEEIKEMEDLPLYTRIIG